MVKEDEKVLKTLVSDTRRDIIKTLSEANRTPTDLSKMLNKSKSTIVEHLGKLINAGLVEKIEKPGYKFVFYSLTKKGESYVSKKSQRLIIILSTIFLSIIGGIFSLMKYLSKSSYGMNKAAGDGIFDGSRELMVQETVSTITPNTTPWLLYLSIGLFVLALAGIFVLIIMKRKRNWEI